MGIYVLGGVNKTPITTYRLKRQEIDLLTLEEAKLFVDERVAENGRLFFETHCFGENWNDPPTIVKMNAIIDYIPSLNIDIINTREG